MTLNDMKKRKNKLIIGAVACILLMLSDFIWKVSGPSAVSTTLGAFADKKWLDMDMWRFVLSNIVAAIAVPLYYIGFSEMYRLVRERAVSKLEKKFASLFKVGVIAGTASLLFIHTLCVNLPMIMKTIAPYMSVEKAAELTNDIMKLNIVPLVGYFIATDVVLSVAMIILIWKKALPLNRLALMCNPLIAAGIGAILAMLPWPFSLIDTVAEPCGHLLIIVVGLIIVNKDIRRMPKLRKKPKDEEDLPPVINLSDLPDADATII